MGKPHTHWRRKITIDTRLESYDVRLTRKWARTIDDAAANSASLSNVVADFAMSMRSIEVTLALPHLVVTQFEHFVTGFTRDSGPPPVQKLATYITERLARSTNIAPECREEIRIECLRIAAKCDAAQITPPFSVDDVWQNYLEHTGYRLALWESQRAGLVNVYNAYESFLQRCMAVAVRQRNYVIRKRFPNDFTREFGEQICDHCWTTSRIQSLRLTRNSIVHEGGRETDQLKRLAHNIQVHDGLLHVFPHDVKAAIELVENRALTLVNAAVKHNSFLAPKRQRRA